MGGAHKYTQPQRLHVINVCYYDDAAIFTGHHAKIILDRTVLVPTLLCLLQ